MSWILLYVDITLAIKVFRINQGLKCRAPIIWNSLEIITPLGESKNLRILKLNNNIDTRANDLNVFLIAVYLQIPIL